MPGTVVTYQRFLEIRQRRNRVAASPTEPPVQIVPGDVLDDHALSVDRGAIQKEQRGRPTDVRE